MHEEEEGRKKNKRVEFKAHSLWYMASLNVAGT